jgi:threonyl-tRNA synthetase
VAFAVLDLHRNVLTFRHSFWIGLFFKTMQTAEQLKSKVAITLPDGSVREYDAPVTGLQIAESIGKRLAKDALAVKVDGKLRDLGTSIADDAAVEIVTRDHPDALELIRHDAAHVMAEAVQTL